ncbi:nitrilase-related carbon-nitrogen hydrolase [Streptomyces sp. DSM 42041]|uniref:Nitrilase-related carbon-nitrogen hydrolase n=1 Tax=Streptomyces hazeniae TaxID=3075538 RepID=A0ABU2NSL4_9ACTN|nr:nitrilase-related carbon-nitrogen hydrolase [Streptomyces sp. DSM 42041]MDT0379980.1 nitrilase-related carbon-nitrogen hydrolase [Streptomyces sp. DSM 42041]
MRIALAQTDCALGDVTGNLERAHRIVRRAAAEGADLVVFPELSLHGYALGRVPEDTSLAADDARLAALAAHGPDVLVGLHEDGRLRRYNAASYLSDGSVLHTHRKLYLPNYLEWEERKHFSPGHALRAFDTAHARVATLICNDAWQPMLPWLAAQDGAEVLLVPTNSADGLAPGAVDTAVYWEDLLLNIARLQQCWVVFVNRVGQEGKASFWGGSRVLDPWGGIAAEAPRWEESLTLVDLDVRAARRRRREMPLLEEARFGLVQREVRRLMQEGVD